MDSDKAKRTKDAAKANNRNRKSRAFEQLGRFAGNKKALAIVLLLLLFHFCPLSHK